MEKLRNRFIVLMCLLLVTGLLVWSHRVLYGVWRPRNDFKVPLSVGPWAGREEGVGERVSRLLEADTVLIRDYFKGDEEIWFAAVYYKDNQVGFHAPEACFGGLGNQVFDEGDVKLYIKEWDRSVLVKKLHYKGEKGEKILHYFYMVNDSIADSEFKIRLRMLWEQLRFRRPGVALFEMYSPVGPKGTEQATENLKDFLVHLIPRLRVHLKLG
jgi:EpsI family protein